MIISKETVQRLLDLQVGDSGRLVYIMETLSKNKPLYKSDQKYLTNLISKYIGVSVEKTHQSQNNLLTEIVNSHLPEKISINYKAILSSFFNMQSSKFSNLAFFLARFGLAFVFAWSGYSMFTNPQIVAEALSQATGTSLSFALDVTVAVGAIEAIGGILLLVGFLTRLVTFTQIIVLIGGAIVFGLDFVNGPTLWKDVGLLGLAIMVLVLGSGKWSLDYLISKKIDRNFIYSNDNRSYNPFDI